VKKYFREFDATDKDYDPVRDAPNLMNVRPPK